MRLIHILLALALLSGMSFAVDVTSCDHITSSGNYIIKNALSGASIPMSGIYFLSNGCIVISASDVVLDCDGKTITNDGTSDAAGIAVNGSYSNITIKNCPSVSGYETGVIGYSFTNSRIYNVTSAYNTEYGIYASGSNDVVDNCTAHSNLYDGIRFSPGQSNLTDSVAYNNSWNGIFFGAYQGRMEGCTAYDNLASFYSGIYVAANQVTIVGNTAHGNVKGIHFINPYHSTSANNTAYNNSGIGILVERAERMTDDNPYVFNNGVDYKVDPLSPSFPDWLNITNLVVDNPRALTHTYENFTNLTIRDFMDYSDGAYSFTWDDGLGTSPSGKTSFHDRYVNTSSSTTSIESIRWTWTDGEVTSGWSESSLKLYFTNGSIWQDTGATLYTSGNYLEHTNYEPYNSVTYGIFGDFVTAGEAPLVNIVTPGNHTYPGPSKLLYMQATAAEGETIDSCWYVLDSGVPVDIPSCYLDNIIGLSDGPHHLVVYANDSSNNVGQDDVYFTIDNVPPVEFYDCMPIEGPGWYELQTDLIGAPNAVDMRNEDLDESGDKAPVSTTCILMRNVTAGNITNVRLDLNGHTITNDATPEASAIAVLDGQNITIGNSSSISGYNRGVALQDADDPNKPIRLSDIASHGNRYNLVMDSIERAELSNLHLFDSLRDDFVGIGEDGTGGGFTGAETVMVLDNVTFDNPLGDYNNFSALSGEVSAIGGAGGLFFGFPGYTFNLDWSDVHSTPPPGYFSVEGKYLFYSRSFFGVVDDSADILNYTWTDGEISDPKYAEDRFTLWRSLGLGWTLVDGTPDTTDNVLSADMSSVNFDGWFAIFQDNTITSCQDITEPGVYTVTEPITGTQGGKDVCIDVLADDVEIKFVGGYLDGVDDTGTGIRALGRTNVKVTGRRTGPLRLDIETFVNNYAKSIHFVQCDYCRTDPIIFCGSGIGVLVNQSNNTVIDDTIACNNSQAGIYILDSDNTTIINSDTFNNTEDLLVNNTLGTSVTLNVSSLVFDRDEDAERYFTDLYLYDTVSAGSAYSIDWAANPGGLPPDYVPFEDKFIDITTLAGTVSIDTIDWTWTDYEVLAGGYNASNIELWLHNGSIWSLLDDVPDTVNNLLSQTSLVPQGTYGLLHNGSVLTPIDLNGANITNITRHARYNAIAGNDSTQGGNITTMNINSTQLTDRWAAYYGNVSGNIVLKGPVGSNAVYRWSYSPSGGGAVCLSTNSSLASLGVLGATGLDIDDAWGFMTGATDSASNTFTSTNCTMSIGSSTILNSSYADTGPAGGFHTCALKSTRFPVKDEVLFCVNIIGGGTAWNGATADFEVMVPTPVGSTETYYFYANLN